MIGIPLPGGPYVRALPISCGPKIVKLQPLLAAWRAEVAPWHPFPPAEACLLYLVSEIGEACDAVAFAQRPGDDRTNHKERHLGRELAQVVDMVFSTAIAYGIDLDAELAAWLEVVRARKP